MINITRKAIQEYCLAKKGGSADFPFDETTQVFRVNGKIFALMSIEGQPPSINLKCDPDWALALRDMYPSVQPGYHMNKKHWNTVTVDGSISDEEIWQMIDHSYVQVAKKLKKAERIQLGLE